MLTAAILLFYAFHQASPSKTSPKKSPVKSPFKGKSPSKMKSPQRGSPQFKVPQGRGPGRKKKLSPKKLKFNTQPRIDQPRTKVSKLINNFSIFVSNCSNLR